MEASGSQASQAMRPCFEICRDLLPLSRNKLKQWQGSGKQSLQTNRLARQNRRPKPQRPRAGAKFEGPELRASCHAAGRAQSGSGEMAAWYSDFTPRSIQAYWAQSRPALQLWSDTAAEGPRNISMAGRRGGWNQFASRKTDYKQKLYTTKLVTQTKEQFLHADRVARELKQSGRVQDADHALDEGDEEAQLADWHRFLDKSLHGH